jgi:hypothetical protein
LKPVIRLKNIKNYSQPHRKYNKTPLQSPIGYAVQREIAVYSVTKGGEGGGWVCVPIGITFFITVGRGRIRKVYCSEAPQAVAARLSGKGKPDLM